MRKPKTAEQILNQFITDDEITFMGTPCHISTVGSNNAEGYRQCWYNGRNRNVHRVAWEHAHGEIKEGMEVGHLCNNRRCINVDHLKLMTHSENIRHSYETNKNRKTAVYLTKQQISFILKYESDVNRSVLAQRYNVCLVTIYNVLSGKTKGKK